MPSLSKTRGRMNGGEGGADDDYQILYCTLDVKQHNAHALSLVDLRLPIKKIAVQ